MVCAVGYVLREKLCCEKNEFVAWSLYMLKIKPTVIVRKGPKILVSGHICSY